MKRLFARKIRKREEGRGGRYTRGSEELQEEDGRKRTIYTWIRRKTRWGPERYTHRPDAEEEEHERAKKRKIHTHGLYKEEDKKRRRTARRKERKT